MVTYSTTEPRPFKQNFYSLHSTRLFSPRSHSNKLTEIEKELLKKRLLDADKRGFPIRPEFLHGIAQILFSNRLQVPTATWNQPAL